MSKTSNLSDITGKFSDPDVYSVICSFLYDLREDPKYSVLSELCYMCNKESFVNILVYLSNTTVRIPSAAEFVDCMRTLLLFQYFEVEGRPWKDAVEAAGFDPKSGKRARNKLDRIKDTLTKYNYGNRNY